MARHRLLSDKEVRQIAFVCAADQLRELSYASEYEDGVVLARGGTEHDTEAVRRYMRRIAEQLRRRAERSGWVERS